MSEIKRITLLENEYWWGGQVSDGVSMPFGKGEFTGILNPVQSANQANPLLLSNKGRYIWSDKPYNFTFTAEEIEITDIHGEIHISEEHEDVREAFHAAKEKYFPPTGKLPDPIMFTMPQYNTWIELMYDQEEEKILKYVDSIIENNMPKGILIIDDNWQEDYGTWKFHEGRFKNPKQMIKKIKQLGFKVMLWTCPFISPDSAVYRELAKEDCLLKDQDGKVAIREWWNGHSAVLDFTNPKAYAWYQDQLDYLVDTYDVDGFKFDAGDPMFYRDTDQGEKSILANEQAELFAEFGKQYELNEYRACWKMAGEPIAQRLSDKTHTWGDYGLGSLIPNGLAQGMLGYAFTCPDMIGGGEYQNFLESSDNLDQELVVRYAQCSALFPMMQFSAAPWRVLDEEHFNYCLEAAQIHEEYGKEILQLAKAAAKNGEPIIRHMAYVFPDGGFEEVKDQFMLGDTILVAPVIEKNTVHKTIHFPTGTWEGDDGTYVEGPCVETVDAPISRLPIYHLQEK